MFGNFNCNNCGYGCGCQKQPKKQCYMKTCCKSETVCNNYSSEYGNSMINSMNNNM